MNPSRATSVLVVFLVLQSVVAATVIHRLQVKVQKQGQLFRAVANMVLELTDPPAARPASQPHPRF